MTYDVGDSMDGPVGALRLSSHGGRDVLDVLQYRVDARGRWCDLSFLDRPDHLQRPPEEQCAGKEEAQNGDGFQQTDGRHDAEQYIGCGQVDSHGRTPIPGVSARAVEPRVR
jgi:hypothetical protein